MFLKLRLKIVPENNANSKTAARKNAKVWLILSRLNAILSLRAAGGCNSALVSCGNQVVTSPVDQCRNRQYPAAFLGTFLLFSLNFLYLYLTFNQFYVDL